MDQAAGQMGDEPFALRFDRQKLTVEFPQPANAPLWHCLALVLKRTQPSGQTI